MLLLSFYRLEGPMLTLYKRENALYRLGQHQEALHINPDTSLHSEAQS